MQVVLLTIILIDNAIPDAKRSLLFQLTLGLFARTLGTTKFQITHHALGNFADPATQTAVWDSLTSAPFLCDNYSIALS
ncbi:hypothetical protein [Nostoc sp.]|uniref:hypothetical protein n=1 Tax=Nostoc sp. TaxID=1180 RepID=UPI002FF44BB5